MLESQRELGQHQVNQMRPEVVGFHAWNPFLTNNSPSRSTMMSSHASQHLVIDGAELPYTLAGVEVEYSKYTTSERVPFDARVFQAIDRYPRGVGQGSLGFNPETVVVIVDDETGLYDVVCVPYHKSYHQYFGYRNKLSDHLKNISPGMKLAKDTVLGDTPANIGGFHTMTTNLNCMLASADIVAEDAVLINEDCLPKLGYKVYERRSANIGVKKFPVNIGTDENYKGFYDIGEYTEDDGALLWLREYSPGLAPVTMSRSATKRINYAFDEPIYARQGHRGRIVDIKVIGNADTISALPPQMTQQLEKYRQAYIRFNEELLECERRICREAYTKFGTNTPNFSKELKAMLVHARAICDHKRRAHNEKPLQGIMNKEPLDEYYIEFVVEYELLPTLGAKLTSLSGDKGVIAQILPSYRMPRDADGNVADVVMAPDGTVARTNFARLYLMQFGAAAVKAGRVLREITGLNPGCSPEEVEYLSDEVFNKAWEFLMKTYACVNPEHSERLDRLPVKYKRLHVYECIEDNPRFIRDIGCKKPAPLAAWDMEQWLPVCYGPVTHQLIEDGHSEPTKDPILIAPLPIMLLDKTAEDTLTVATAAHGPFGVLIKHNQADKYSKPWKDSPARTIGESEARAYAAHTQDPEMIADMMDRASNPVVQLQMARALVSCEHSGNIDNIIDRTQFDYGDTRPIGIATNFLHCYGVEMVYVPEEGKVYP
jgi:hypothetical protein